MNRNVKITPKAGPRMNFGPKAKTPLKTVKRLMGYVFRKYKVQMIIVVLAILISSLANVIGVRYLQVVIDDFLDVNPANRPLFAELTFVLLGLVLIYLSGALSTYLYNRLMINVSLGTLKDIRDELFVKMETLPIRYFDRNTHGELMSRYTNDTDTLRQMISQSLPQLISSTITILSVIVLMITTSWLLSIIAFIDLFVIVQIIKRIGGKSRKYFGAQQRALGEINGYIEEHIEGQKVVKVFNHEEKCKEEFDALNTNLCNVATKANIFTNILMPIMNNLGHLQYAITAVIGGILVFSKIDGWSFNIGGIDFYIWFGTLTVGGLVSFVGYAKLFTRPITEVSQQFNSIIMALSGAERIFDVMDEKSEVDDGYVTLVNAKYEDNELVEANEKTGIWAWKHPHHDGTVTYTKVAGDVRFFDVDFGYTEKNVLNNISLFAKPGQKIAFVGSTGAGKTTITNLINRFYDVQDGKIRFDGININKIKKNDLRRALAMVLQDTHLFSGTVMDNIRYGRLDATDEECIEAAKLSNADYFISHLPEGYQTQLSGDGENLSQGQRQLLAIARAAVADPPVLILDEATSSIDTRTESLVEKGMDRLMEGRTVFVIAHRLSTVRNSHAIMVLENGEIIERGSHDELIAQKGKYYQLYTGTFELS